MTRCGPAATLCGPATTLWGPATTLCGPATTLCGPATSFVGAALVTSGLVTMAFLLALRLLIRDFFEIDIACSLFFVFD